MPIRTTVLLLGFTMGVGGVGQLLSKGLSQVHWELAEREGGASSKIRYAIIQYIQLTIGSNLHLKMLQE